jgi:hypothetical protein
MRTLLSIMSFTLLGCGGLLELAEAERANAEEGGLGRSADGGLGASCDPAMYAGVQLADALAAFRTDVYPNMVDGDAQCSGCHAANSGRLFKVTADSTETFEAARRGGFFADGPGSLFARLSSRDDNVRMPMGGPAWSAPALAAVAKVACMVRAVASGDGGPAADEQFPAELLRPYTGAPITQYDNTFLNFVQLKAKVKAVFNDSWVRNNVDQFATNIGLFGGVNFSTHSVEARAATSDFLMGLDALAPDVCGAAVANGTGPFSGLTPLTASIADVPAQSTTTVEIESLTPSPATGIGSASTNPAGFFCHSNCTFTTPYLAPSPGLYRITVRAKPTLDGSVFPSLRVRVGSTLAPTTLDFANRAAYEEKSVDVMIATVGSVAVSVNFFNNSQSNGGDSNIWLDSIKILGPLGAGSGAAESTAAKAKVNTLYERMLYRSATAGEQTAAHAFLVEVAPLGTLPTAWSALCEALVRHPDFLFTMPPSIEKMTAAAQKDRMRLVGLTQRALGRPPTEAEFTQLNQSGFAQAIESVFTSGDFRTYYFNRIQMRIESQGTAESDEPARLWTYVTLNGRPYSEVLTADYTVDANFMRKSRPAHHGKTGVLTMKGYLNNKPGLPHYNYPARVVSGFMGRVFEVPPEVFDQREASTASSTVDASSICYQCHQILTPLAHQRLKWSDNGDYRQSDANGPIDDSDRGLVPNYPYKGAGLESFTLKAVRKEPFIRRMINTQFRLLLGRELRADLDERGLYKQLWDEAANANGDMRVVLRVIANSTTFKGMP